MGVMTVEQMKQHSAMTQSYVKIQQCLLCSMDLSRLEAADGFFASSKVIIPMLHAYAVCMCASKGKGTILCQDNLWKLLRP